MDEEPADAAGVPEPPPSAAAAAHDKVVSLYTSQFAKQYVEALVSSLDDGLGEPKDRWQDEEDDNPLCEPDFYDQAGKRRDVITKLEKTKTEAEKGGEGLHVQMRKVRYQLGKDDESYLSVGTLMLACGGSSALTDSETLYPESMHALQKSWNRRATATIVEQLRARMDAQVAAADKYVNELWKWLCERVRGNDGDLNLLLGFGVDNSNSLFAADGDAAKQASEFITKPEGNVIPEAVLKNASQPIEGIDEIANQVASEIKNLAGRSGASDDMPPPPQILGSKAAAAAAVMRHAVMEEAVQSATLNVAARTPEEAKKTVSDLELFHRLKIERNRRSLVAAMLMGLLLGKQRPDGDTDEGSKDPSWLTDAIEQLDKASSATNNARLPKEPRDGTGEAGLVRSAGTADDAKSAAASAEEGAKALTEAADHLTDGQHELGAAAAATEAPPIFYLIQHVCRVIGVVHEERKGWALEARQLHAMSASMGGRSRDAVAADADAAAKAIPIDSSARERRQAIWVNALRELSVSGDPLFAFVRQMAGLIGESATAVLQIDESRLDANLRQRQADQRELLKAEFTLQQTVVREVVSSVFKESGFRLDTVTEAGGGGGGGGGGTDTGGADALLSRLAVVPANLGEQIRATASSEASMGFLDSQVLLQNFLAKLSDKPTPLRDMLSGLRGMLFHGAEQRLAKLTDASEEGVTASLQYLSLPQNAYLVSLKTETFAAIRSSFNWFRREVQARCYSIEPDDVRAWHLIEGPSMAIRDAFAEVCAATMSTQRMFSPSAAQFISAGAASQARQRAGIAMHTLLEECDAHQRSKRRRR